MNQLAALTTSSDAVQLTPGQAVRFARLQDAIMRLTAELNQFKLEVGLDPDREYEMSPATGEMVPIESGQIRTPS